MRNDGTKTAYSFGEKALLAILALELLYLVYCNLFHIADNIESDIAKMMVHTMEMAEHGRLLLPEWIYTTTAEWDSVALPAVFFYRLTGNIFLSYGIVNCINIGLFLFLTERLLRQNGTERFWRLFALAVLFGLYDMEDIWYTADMLYTAGAQYIYKVMPPLLLLVLLTTEKDKRRSMLSVALHVLFFIMTLITAMSSGVYVLLCGLCPVIFSYALFYLYMLRGKTDPEGRNPVKPLREDPYPACVIFFTLMTYGAGWLLCRAFHVSPGSSTPMNIRSLSEILSRPFKTFTTLLQVWSLIPEHTSDITVVQAVGMVSKVVLIAALLLFGVLSLRHLFRDHGLQSCLITVFSWNYGILFLTYSTPRYQLIGAVPLMLCAVLEAQRFFEKRERMQQKNRIAEASALLLFFIGVASVFFSEHIHFHKFDLWEDVTTDLKARLDALDVQTVIWLNRREMPEILRLYDRTPDRVYTNLVVPEQGDPYAFNWNTYYPAEDRSGYSDRNVILATTESYARMPDHVQRAYTKLPETLDVYAGGYINETYGIYLSDTCPVDGSSGLPKGATAIDLPCSAGYLTAGEIDAAGELFTTAAGTVYESVGFFLAEGESVQLTLDYSLQGTASDAIRAEITDRDGVVEQEVSLQQGDNTLTCEIAGPKAHRLRVVHDGSCTLRIGQLLMRRD